MTVRYDFMECNYVKGVTWNSNIKICKIKLLVFPKILIITNKKIIRRLYFQVVSIMNVSTYVIIICMI